MSILSRILLVCLITAAWSAEPATTGPRARVEKATIKLFFPNHQKYGLPYRPDYQYCWADMAYPHVEYALPTEVVRKEEQSFHSVRLQNDLILMEQVSDLGGATMVCRDKRTGKDILLSSRAPWLARTFIVEKGSHVSFPYTEHGLNSLEPWPFTWDQDESGAWTLFEKTDHVTGMRLRTKTFLPHDGYYMDVRAELTNLTGEWQKGMVWSVHTAENHPGTHLFFPGKKVLCHTSFSVPDNRGYMDMGVDYLTPVPWPVMNGRDMTDYRNWPGMKGLYAGSLPDSAWAGLHNRREKRGVVKVLCEGFVGLKTFGGPEHAELFAGITPTLEHYTQIEPGGVRTIYERVLPTTGMTWLTHANLAGVLGVYRVAESNELVAEFLLCDPARTTGADSIWIAVTAGGTTVARAGFPAVAGRRAEARLNLGAGRKTGRLGKGFDVFVTSAKETIIGSHLTLDSVRVFPRDSIAEPPLREIIAGQASSKTFDPEKQRMEAKKRVEKFRPELVRIYAPEKEKEEPHRAPLRVEYVPMPGSAARDGRRTYILCEKELLIYEDHTGRPAVDSIFGYNSTFRVLVDSAFRPESITRKSVKIPDARWYGEVLVIGNRLVLGVGKRLEIRDTAGTLLDSIALATWAGPMRHHTPGRIVMTLPFEDALAVVDINKRTLVRHSVAGYPGFRHPWALTRTPEGWAVSSSLDKKLLKLDETFGNGRVLSLPAVSPLRTQYRGTTALVWHPGHKALLAADLDNMRVIKVDLQGKVLGTFVAGGDGDKRVHRVRHMSVDGSGNVLLTYAWTRRVKYGLVKLFSAEGRFLGALGSMRRGHVQYPVGHLPWGSDSTVAFSWWSQEFQMGDSNGTTIRAASTQGWGDGQTVYPSGAFTNDAQGTVLDRHYGFFVADPIKHTVIYYDTAFSFTQEIAAEKLEYFTPKQIALDADGNLFAIDGLRNSVLSFRRDSKGMYAFEKEFGNGSPIAMQRVYTHGKTIVVGDMFEGEICRYTGDGRLLGHIRLPEDFRPSLASVVDSGGNLLINELRGGRVLSVSRSGKVRILKAPGLRSETSVIHRADRFPKWRADRRPVEAAYIAVDWDNGNYNYRWLDGRFRETVRVDSIMTEIALTPKSITGYTLMGDTVVAGCERYPGFVKICPGTGAFTAVPLELKKRHLDLIRAKNDSVFGAVTSEPRCYVEFDRKGTLLRRIDELPVARFWNFSYTRKGELLLPDFRYGLVHVLDTRGKVVRRVETGLRSIEDVVEGPGGTLYALDWQNGRIVSVNERDSVSEVFCGAIDGEPVPGDCAWLVMLDPERLAFADNRNGTVHVIGTDGTWRGSFGATEKKESWSYELWGGQALGAGEISFWGKGALHTLSFRR